VTHDDGDPGAVEVHECAMCGEWWVVAYEDDLVLDTDE
jgi:hypothetical protein